MYSQIPDSHAASQPSAADKYQLHLLDIGRIMHVARPSVRLSRVGC